MTKTIRIAALAIRNHNNEILHVRKRGTKSFIMVGGKLEPGETGLDAALREVVEETGLVFGPEGVRTVGKFTAPAANESRYVVECDVFVTADQLRIEAVTVQREIEEYRWFGLDSVADELAPLSRDVVHPALVALL